MCILHQVNEPARGRALARPAVRLIIPRKRRLIGRPAKNQPAGGRGGFGAGCGQSIRRQSVRRDVLSENGRITVGSRSAHGPIRERGPVPAGGAGGGGGGGRGYGGGGGGGGGRGTGRGDLDGVADGPDGLVAGAEVVVHLPAQRPPFSPSARNAAPRSSPPVQQRLPVLHDGLWGGRRHPLPGEWVGAVPTPHTLTPPHSPLLLNFWRMRGGCAPRWRRGG